MLIRTDTTLDLSQKAEKVCFELRRKRVKYCGFYTQFLRKRRFGPEIPAPVRGKKQRKNEKKHKSKTLKFDQKIKYRNVDAELPFQSKKKKKQIVQTAAESQSIVVQDNSNSYNTGSTLSRLQMI